MFRPHRFFGLPSLIDPLLQPNDKYNKPKAPAITETPEQQAYQMPISRDQLMGQDAENRRRLIAGVVTGAQGVTGAASTTRTPLPVGGG